MIPGRSVLRASVLAALALPAGAQGADPFTPGLRWVLQEPSLPRACVFGARENLVWTAWSGANPGFSAAAVFGGASALDAQPLAPGGTITAAAGEAGEALFEALQVPQPDAVHRATRVRRVSAVPALSGGSFATAWEHDFPFTTNGPARLACDAAGTQVVCAVWRSTSSVVRLERLDAASGNVLASTEHSGGALSELALSGDGSIAVLAAGLDLWILDASGASAHHAMLAGSTTALAVDGTGELVAHGGATVRVLERAGGAYATAFTIGGSTGEIAARVALARDGSTLAVGWWNAAAGSGVRFEAWDVASRTRLFEHAQPANGSNLQNFPEVVRVSHDGTRALLGAWGDGGSNPEVVLYDRASDATVLEVDLPGSVLGLALDARGRRIAVSMKSTHANLLAGSGEVRVYDTGEAELAVLGAPQAGGDVVLAARRGGAQAAYFLMGTPNAQPLVLPGIAGELHLRRVGLTAWRRSCDANGRADVVIPLPLQPALIGTTLYFQAAFRSGATTSFDDELVPVLVL